MNIAHIGEMLVDIERLAAHLRADPDGHVCRSANELRIAFDTRSALEPALQRMRQSIEMLRRDNHSGLRREFQRRAPALDHLEQIIEEKLLPRLRQLGFDV